MTSSDSLQIIPFTFDNQAESRLAGQDPRLSNWPAVYLLRQDEKQMVYVGESTNVARRIGQHYSSPDKEGLKGTGTNESSRIILDGQFNKSAALDLEAFLIQHLAGEGHYKLLNRNDGIVDRDYFRRDEYQERFRTSVFDKLRRHGVFSRSLRDIENDDLFKLSPYKSLQPSQEHAVRSILEIILKEIEGTVSQGPTVVEGDPGTGKTIVAVFLVKLLVDIVSESAGEQLVDDDRESYFTEFFMEGSRRVLDSLLSTGLGIGLVVPQQSLRDSIKKVFKRIPNLDPAMVVDPFTVGKSHERYSLLIVDEAHRLNRRSNQSSGVRNKDFKDINHRLFAGDDRVENKNQLDWITAQSDHQVIMVDSNQTVRPADIPVQTLKDKIVAAERAAKHHRLVSQLRVAGGQDYIEHIRSILHGAASAPKDFGEYEFRFFEDPGTMHREIRKRDREHGLARMAAGYAWEWKTKGRKSGFDIEIGDYRARWNSVAKDWVDSPGSLDEVGSIHTLQGYDLNYTGVIVGNELKYNPQTKRIFLDRSQYFDKKGKENNRSLGRNWTDEEILEYIKNIYFVLMTRGRLGTFVYVCDTELRRHMRASIPYDMGFARMPIRSESAQFEEHKQAPHGLPSQTRE